jgi:hypothetical protein
MSSLARLEVVLLFAVIVVIAGCGNTRVSPAPNAAPVAVAGSNQTVAVGESVILNGTDSWDANNDPLTFAWTLTTRPTGSTAILASGTTATPTFTPDVAGTYIARLIVNDGTTNSTPATVTTSATEAAPVVAYYLFGAPDHINYLGCLDCSPEHVESICNRFGNYGSPFSAMSIWHQFGTYGSQFSPYSPWNQFSTSGPIIVGSDSLFYGYFTTNGFQFDRTTIPAFVRILDFYSTTLDLESTRSYACGN